MANYDSAPKIDLTGKQFGRLTAQEYAGHSRWKCICSCGSSAIVKTFSLNTGRTQSCGCLRKEVAAKKATKHGGAHDDLYHVLNMMHQRCENPKCKDFKWYGAEGKHVCPEWSMQNYPAFREWAIKSGYRKGLTIDRIDPNKGYCPDNCRWITISEQQSNRRGTKEQD